VWGAAGILVSAGCLREALQVGGLWLRLHVCVCTRMRVHVYVCVCDCSQVRGVCVWVRRHFCINCSSQGDVCVVLWLHVYMCVCACGWVGGCGCTSFLHQKVT